MAPLTSPFILIPTAKGTHPFIHSSPNNNRSLCQLQPASPLPQGSRHKIDVQANKAQHRTQSHSLTLRIQPLTRIQIMQRHLKTTPTPSANSLCDGSLALLPRPHHRSSCSSKNNNKTCMAPLPTLSFTDPADPARKTFSPTQRVSGLASGSVSSGSPFVDSGDSTQTTFPPFSLLGGSAQLYSSSSEPQPPSV